VLDNVTRLSVGHGMAFPEGRCDHTLQSEADRYN
jgi:hypothetical protein